MARVIKKYGVASAFCLAPGRDVYAGDLVEIDEREGRRKVTQGYLRELPLEEPKATPKEVPAPEVVADVRAEAHPDVGEPETISTRDPEPAPGRSPKARAKEKA